MLISTLTALAVLLVFLLMTSLDTIKFSQLLSLFLLLVTCYLGRGSGRTASLSLSSRFAAPTSAWCCPSCPPPPGLHPGPAGAAPPAGGQDRSLLSRSRMFNVLNGGWLHLRLPGYNLILSDLRLHACLYHPARHLTQLLPLRLLTTRTSFDPPLRDWELSDRFLAAWPKPKPTFIHS